MGGCAVALAGLQPTGAAAFAASTAIWVACARFYVRLAIAVAITITAALCVVDVTVAHVSTASVLATALLCALLALMARFMRTAWDNQDRTELLLAELQDARDSQAAAAAAAERARIAGDLHDVLAHSLSGVAIQLQVARKMADTQATSQQLRETIATASRLTRDSLGDARRAVDALRGEEQPTLDQLDALVTAYRRDARLDVTVTVDGDRRRLAPAAELALYRGVEEALTNVARHAPGTMATVTVTYRPDCATVVIADTGPGPGSEHADLHGVGGGHGLSGMRERISAAGGTMSAGPGDGGWTVMLQVPS
jgi:signal transduction histidine kinase